MYLFKAAELKECLLIEDCMNINASCKNTITRLAAIYFNTM